MRDMVPCLLSFHSNKDIKGSIMMLSSSLLWRISGWLEHREGIMSKSTVSFPTEEGSKPRLEGRMGVDWVKSLGQSGKLQPPMVSLMGTYSVLSNSGHLFSVPGFSLPHCSPPPFVKAETPCHWALCLVQNQKSIQGNCGPWWIYFLLSVKGPFWRGQFELSAAKEQGWNLHCTLEPNFLLFSPKHLQTNKTLGMWCLPPSTARFPCWERVTDTESTSRPAASWTQLPPDLLLWWPTALAPWWVIELHFPKGSDNRKFFYWAEKYDPLNSV